MFTLPPLPAIRVFIVCVHCILILQFGGLLKQITCEKSQGWVLIL